MTDKNDWQGRVGASWAAEWERTDRSFGALTDRLLGAASAGKFTSALDIGCGAGELALALARGHHGAAVTGIDISARLLDVAQKRGNQLANLKFHLADASIWSPAEYSPDLLVSRHGVMFFDDPAAAFANLANIAAANARLVFSCFRGPAENEWARQIVALLPDGTVQPSDPIAPGPFAFADPDRVTQILTESGWRDVAFEEVDYPYVAGAGRYAVDDSISYLLAIGPAARIAAGLDEAARDHFIGRLRRYLTASEQDGIVALHAAAWIVTATAPADR